MGSIVQLKEYLCRLKRTQVGIKVLNRLDEFSRIKSSPPQLWFSELCFCILTSNSKAQTAWNIQKELGFGGFMEFSQKELSGAILRNKHRFHNTKAKYIIANRRHHGTKEVRGGNGSGKVNCGIKGKVTSIIAKDGIFAAREWLAENILGFGFKEASHFLRNVGYLDLAILDRHILHVMLEHKVIPMIPTLSPKNYLRIEEKFLGLSSKVGMEPGELDMYLWYMEAGDVMK